MPFFVGRGGVHHVNERPAEYWIRMFNSIAFEHDPELTRAVRTRSTTNLHRPPNKRFVGMRALAFVPVAPGAASPAEAYRESGAAGSSPSRFRTLGAFTRARLRARRRRRC